jgi:hypothetical protein
MKPKLIFCLALVVGGGFFCCHAVAQNLSQTNQWRGFPVLPPLTNINPFVTHPVQVQLPTGLKIERTADTLSIAISTNGLESTNLMVGSNMVTGVEDKIYVYPEGESRPANGGLGLSGGLDFNLGTLFWHTKPDGIPLAGKRYIVEIELTAFETDIPPQHMWMPRSKNFKVIWQGTLKEIIRP